jgi:hypothetical protein
MPPTSPSVSVSVAVPSPLPSSAVTTSSPLPSSALPSSLSPASQSSLFDNTAEKYVLHCNVVWWRM